MRGVGRAAAAAAEQQFEAGGQAAQNHLGRAVQRLFQSRQTAERGDGILNCALERGHDARLGWAGKKRKPNHASTESRHVNKATAHREYTFIASASARPSPSGMLRTQLAARAYSKAVPNHF